MNLSALLTVLIPQILILLAHLVGLVLAIILLVRYKGTAAILATVAFALLFLLDVGAILRDASLDRWLWGLGEPELLPWALGGLNCCCGLIGIIAAVCLIIAVWQAVSGSAKKGHGELAEEIDVE